MTTTDGSNNERNESLSDNEVDWLDDGESVDDSDLHVGAGRQTPAHDAHDVHDAAGEGRHCELECRSNAGSSDTESNDVILENDRIDAYQSFFVSAKQYQTQGALQKGVWECVGGVGGDVGGDVGGAVTGDAMGDQCVDVVSDQDSGVDSDNEDGSEKKTVKFNDNELYAAQEAFFNSLKRKPEDEPLYKTTKGFELETYKEKILKLEREKSDAKFTNGKLCSQMIMPHSMDVNFTQSIREANEKGKHVAGEILQYNNRVELIDTYNKVEELFRKRTSTVEDNLTNVKATLEQLRESKRDQTKCIAFIVQNLQMIAAWEMFCN